MRAADLASETLSLSGLTCARLERLFASTSGGGSAGNPSNWKRRTGFGILVQRKQLMRGRWAMQRGPWAQCSAGRGEDDERAAKGAAQQRDRQSGRHDGRVPRGVQAACRVQEAPVLAAAVPRHHPGHVPPLDAVLHSNLSFRQPGNVTFILETNLSI